MYAIVDIAGDQYKLSTSDNVVTARLQGDPGTQVEFDRVLLLATGKETRVGTPYVKGAVVQATILEHDKADKVRVFRKKRRKGFKVLRGHRQPQTRIQITKIVI